MTDEWTPARRDGFAAAIGDGEPSPWRAAFAAVPRHVFVPEFFQQDEGGRWVRVTASDPGYLASVYSDTALMTQLDAGGVPTSSSSEPGLMLAMLDALDAAPGDRVFELGTGTGYNAALLAHRLGADNVTSMDVDPALVAIASRRLSRFGAPFVLAGDGALGCPQRAPYTRIIATAALRTIPRALIDQAAEGAVIIAPIGFGIVRATVGPEGQANGRFLPRPARFMPRRTPGTRPEFEAAGNAPATFTTLPVAEALDRWSFPLSLALPGYTSCSWHSDDGEVTGIGLWTEDGSTVRAHVDGNVRQTGPRRLWDIVEDVAARFPSGQPACGDFGITITPGGGRVWYGDPDGTSWTLPDG
jgi:protein-L-isoaspartate O-methyltransferase